MTTRQSMWDQLGADVDLLVIGGGITGAGVARDAARRGLSVAVIEQGDLASGTSSRSSKLVHGGLRYLEQYEFSLVFEAVSERRILMDLAPHLVNPLGFLFPIYEASAHKLWFINAGMWLYDGLSLFRSPRLHRQLNAKDVAKEEPAVLQKALKGAPLYYDCSTDDARLTLETAIDAVGHGATIATWSRAESFLKHETGRICGAVVKDVVSGELKEVRAHAVVNATGPWTDRTIAMTGVHTIGSLLRPTKGVHLVVDFQKLPLHHAVVCLHPEDERVLFAIPWGDRTYLGTTDTDFSGDPGHVAANKGDVDYLLEASAHYFPDHPLTHGDIISTWAGVRPLMGPPSDEGDIDESAISREHQIVVGQDGLITIAGGKLTTYRRMSGEVVDTVVRLLQRSQQLDKKLDEARTDEEPLPGGVGWPDDDDHDAVAAQVVAAGATHIEPDTARYLADNYGMRSLALAKRCATHPELAARLIVGRPEVLAQIDWSIDEEFAARLSDVMMRRTQLYYRDTDQGLGAAHTVAEHMARKLSWTDERTRSEIQLYETEVEMSRRWRRSN